MQISLLVIGKTTDQRLVSLISDYAQRLCHYVPFNLVVIPDLKNAKAMSKAQIKTVEGNEILRLLPPSTEAVLLDEHGRGFRSVEFADWLQKRMSSGRDLTLVIGGPYGFSPEVYARADGKISLSPMTFSHQMVRLFAVEQLYRAMTILRGEPYHHE